MSDDDVVVTAQNYTETLLPAMHILSNEIGVLLPLRLKSIINRLNDASVLYYNDKLDSSYFSMINCKLEYEIELSNMLTHEAELERHCRQLNALLLTNTLVDAHKSKLESIINSSNNVLLQFARVITSVTQFKTLCIRISF